MLKVLITSDIHFETLEKDSLINYIKYFKDSLEYTKPDAFIIAGDTTDSQYLRMGSDDTLWLNKFLVEIAYVCANNDIKFFILRGTPSHDGWNVSNLINVGDTILNNTIQEVNEASIHGVNGTRILFIPETYLPTYDDFDNMISNLGVNEHNPVDLVVFHGMFDFAIEQVKQRDSSHGLNRSIIMNSKKIGKITRTCAIGGHFHAYMVYDNIVYTDRFINTRGHWSNDSHLFGLKLLTIDDNMDWKVENCDNPYLIKQDKIHLDFINQPEDELIAISKTYINKLNDVIFFCYLNSEPSIRQKFNTWIEVINPKFIHKINRDTDGKIIRATTKAESTQLDETNIESMVTECYLRKYGENEDSIMKDVLKEIMSNSDE